MTNDTSTLNGALSQLGETMASNLTAKGVTASASDGLTTLASKVNDISTLPGENWLIYTYQNEHTEPSSTYDPWGFSTFTLPSEWSMEVTLKASGSITCMFGIALSTYALRNSYNYLQFSLSGTKNISCVKRGASGFGDTLFSTSDYPVTQFNKFKMVATNYNEVSIYLNDVLKATTTCDFLTGTCKFTRVITDTTTMKNILFKLKS